MLLMLTTVCGCLRDQPTLLPPPSLVRGSRDVSTRQPLAVATQADLLPSPQPEALSRIPALAELPIPPGETRDWQYVVLHHSASAGGSVSSIDTQHRKLTDNAGRPWLGIGYHFVVGNGVDMPDGHVEATFRWHDQLPGAHAGQRTYNDQGIGICLIGNFDESPPTERQLAACKQLVRRLCEQFDIDAERVVGHRDVKATECPGRHFPLNEVAQAVLERREASGQRAAMRTRRELLSGDRR